MKKSASWKNHRLRVPREIGHRSTIGKARAPSSGRTTVVRGRGGASHASTCSSTRMRSTWRVTATKVAPWGESPAHSSRIRAVASPADAALFRPMGEPPSGPSGPFANGPFRHLPRPRRRRSPPVTRDPVHPRRDTRARGRCSRSVLAFDGESPVVRARLSRR